MYNELIQKGDLSIMKTKVSFKDLIIKNKEIIIKDQKEQEKIYEKIERKMVQYSK